MAKKWTVCTHADTGRVVYVQTLKRFIEHHGLEQSTVYAIRSGRGDQHHHKGWAFAFHPGDPPLNAVVFDEAAFAAGADPYPERDPDAVGVAEAFEDEDDDSDAALAELLADVTGDESPQEIVRKMSAALGKLMVQSAKGDKSISVSKIKNLSAALKDYASVYGIDPSENTDGRPIEEQVRDLLQELLITDQAAYEATDEQLDGLIAEMLKAVQRSGELYDEINKRGVRACDVLSVEDLQNVDPLQDPGGPPGPKVIAELANRWVRRLRKVKRLARWAREPCEAGMSRREEFAWRTTHLIRFMSYVGRPDIPGMTHFIYADFHVEIAAKLWMMKNRWRIDSRHGLIAPGDMLEGRPFEGEDYYGGLFMVPPRHSKTEMISVYDTALDNIYDTRDQQAILHADKDTASNKMLVPVQTLFRRDNNAGRRLARLYPEVRISKSDNTKHRFRLHNAQRPSNPNLITGSPFTAGLGNNLNKLRLDDVVEASDRYEPTTRERRSVLINTTWVTRLHGKHGLVIVTGYPHHPDDFTWKLYLQALEYQSSGGRSGANIMVVRRAVGGPKTVPPFKPIWPEMYDAKWLRNRYNALNCDDTVWSSNFMLLPVPADKQIVRRVRLYDPTAPEVVDFLERASYHLSVDPAAKGEEANDKAGLVLVAVGDMQYEREVGGGLSELYTERMALVVHEDEFHASQPELTAHMVAMGARYNIECGHIEQVTGLGTDMQHALEEHYGIRQVKLHGTANKNKAQRLRAVAPVLEHSNPDVPARVAFPGVRLLDERGREQPTLVPRGDMVRLIDYVTKFFAKSGFHSMDALTQVLRDLVATGEIHASSGAFSRELAEGFGRRVVNRKLQLFAENAAKLREREQDGEYAGIARNPYNMV
ncbi:MAG: hypothetical protein ACX94C_11705 [Phycisphaerales bacterium]